MEDIEFIVFMNTKLASNIIKMHAIAIVLSISSASINWELEC